MRILLTADTVGGVWDHAVTLAHALDARGHEVLLAVIGDPRGPRLAHVPGGVQVVWRTYRLEWMRDAADDVRAAGEWLAGLAHAWLPDVVHLNQMAYAAHAFPAPVLVVVHSDVVSWWGEVMDRPPPPDQAGYAAWVRAGLAAADVVAAPSAYQAAMVERNLGARDVRVVHNGVAAPGAPPEGREPITLGVGRAWDVGKGIDVLDAAAGRLGEDGFPVHVVGDLVGPGGERFHPRYATAHGRVERAEVDAWMRRASIFVSASRYEPFGLGPLEAALHGCALVLSDIGSYRELWDGCAAFFPCGDAAALADALRAQASDAPRRERLAAAARKRALRRYTDARMASAYLELYEAMCRVPPAPRPTAGRILGKR